MFTELRARNFKSWQDLPQLRLAPINGIFGSNSSGKTSLLQLLLLMKQTATSADRLQPLQFGDINSPLELGSLKDVLYNHDLNRALMLSFKWEMPEPLEILDPATSGEVLFRTNSLAFETVVEPAARGAMSVARFQYVADEETVVEMKRASTRHGRRAAEYDLHARVFGREYLRRTPGRAWPLPAPVKSYGFPDEAVAYYQNSGFVADLELALDRQFTDRTYYLGPLRSSPARQYRWQGTRPPDVGVAGERAIEALLASRDEGRTNTRGYNSRGRARRRITVEEHVAQWLKELHLIEDFKLERLSEDADIYRVLVRQEASASPVALTDVGFGVSQVLPVLVLLAWVPAGATVLLEQPEIHLHPAVQTGLADVIIEAARVRGVQVVLESHSEHLLRRLQLRAAEQSLPTQDVTLYFCSLSPEGSLVEDLRLNDLGEIENWPRDFFGDPLRETAAIARAAIARRISLRA